MAPPSQDTPLRGAAFWAGAAMLGIAANMSMINTIASVTKPPTRTSRVLEDEMDR
ncbi:MAG: hypothetical protein J5I90_10115 [Caldilineales bacterium]|nr:hypothetical protein [Caldilineales bacterium]